MMDLRDTRSYGLNCVMYPEIRMLKSQPPVLQNVTLFGNCVAAEGISYDAVVLEGGEALTQHIRCPYKKEKRGHRRAYRENTM